jgi:hypothetical protein
MNDCISIEDYRRLHKNGKSGLAVDKKRNKYFAEKVTVDGIVFDSGHEAERYIQLKLFVAAGVIKNLRLQVPFRIEVNSIRICTYKADFVYEEAGSEIVEDAKGKATRIYNLKKRLMKAILGITIKEYKKADKPPRRKRRATR